MCLVNANVHLDVANLFPALEGLEADVALARTLSHSKTVEAFWAAKEGGRSDESTLAAKFAMFVLLGVFEETN